MTRPSLTLFLTLLAVPLSAASAPAQAAHDGKGTHGAADRATQLRALEALALPADGLRASLGVDPKVWTASIAPGQEPTAERVALGKKLSFDERDLLVWKRETEPLVAAGARLFHGGDELGSTVAVSCDMCHPDAANTHAETYPKYPAQMGKAVLLRDMINWRVQHPVRAPAMAGDDARMRALVAYSYAQRSGTPLAFGKH